MSHTTAYTATPVTVNLASGSPTVFTAFRSAESAGRRLRGTLLLTDLASVAESRDLTLTETIGSASRKTTIRIDAGVTTRLVQLHPFDAPGNSNVSYSLASPAAGDTAVTVQGELYADAGEATLAALLSSLAIPAPAIKADGTVLQIAASLTDGGTPQTLTSVTIGVLRPESAVANPSPETATLSDSNTLGTASFAGLADLLTTETFLVTVVIVAGGVTYSEVFTRAPVATGGGGAGAILLDTTTGGLAGSASTFSIAAEPELGEAIVGNAVRIYDADDASVYWDRTIVDYEPLDPGETPAYLTVDEDLPAGVVGNALPAGVVSGDRVVVYAGAPPAATAAPTVDQIAERLLSAPANKLATDGDGKVTTSNPGSGGGPVALEGVDPDFLVNASRRYDGVFVADRPLYLDEGEGPICGVSVADRRTRFKSMAAPVSTDEEVATVDQTEGTGYGCDPLIAKFRPTIDAEAAAGAKCRVRFYAETTGGRRLFEVDLIKRQA